MINIALLGYGRMGQKIYEIAQNDTDFEVLFAIDNRQDIATQTALPVIDINQFNKTIKKNKPDVIIDFSHPQATLDVAPIALKHDISMVTCTTGFTDDQQQTLQTLANVSDAAFLLSPNITPGINIWMLFTKLASRMLTEYDIQITDYHFREKHDSPSGTAKKMVAELEEDGKTADVYGVRAGKIVGTHSSLLAGQLDQITIAHQSYSKDIFAQSALDAAKAIVGRQGFLEMKDILNFEEVTKCCIDEV